MSGAHFSLDKFIHSFGSVARVCDVKSMTSSFTKGSQCKVETAA